MHVGVAPLPVSSGQSNRHRLNRCGNRRLNSTIHMIARVVFKTKLRTERATVGKVLGAEFAADSVAIAV